MAATPADESANEVSQWHMAFPTEQLPVTSAGWTMTEIDGSLAALPSIALDTAGRPDVADLSRVHASEGVGDIRTAATHAGNGAIRFDVVMTTPVLCHVAFTVGQEHRKVLEHAAYQQTLVLATGDPTEVGASWLAVEIDGPALQRLVDELATPVG